MCLAIPAKILEINHAEHRALVDYSGAKRQVGSYLEPEAQVGDYVLVHAGEIISILSAAEATETLKIWEECLEPEGD